MINYQSKRIAAQSRLLNFNRSNNLNLFRSMSNNVSRMNVAVIGATGQAGTIHINNLMDLGANVMAVTKA